MKVRTFEIEGLLLIEPKVHADDRGYFFESYNSKAFSEAVGIDPVFVQDNESQSQKGVLRGLHFQMEPHAQGKLVRVVRGEVLDVAVDLRKGSKTFGKHQSVILSEYNKHQFYIPPGFAHGFAVRANDTLFVYKCTAYYNRSSERTLLWNDPDLSIDWDTVHPILSDKDANHAMTLQNLRTIL